MSHTVQIEWVCRSEMMPVVVESRGWRVDDRLLTRRTCHSVEIVKHDDRRQRRGGRHFRKQRWRFAREVTSRSWWDQTWRSCLEWRRCGRLHRWKVSVFCDAKKIKIATINRALCCNLSISTPPRKHSDQKVDAARQRHRAIRHSSTRTDAAAADACVGEHQPCTNVFTTATFRRLRTINHND